MVGKLGKLYSITRMVLWLGGCENYTQLVGRSSGREVETFAQYHRDGRVVGMWLKLFMISRKVKWLECQKLCTEA